MAGNIKTFFEWMRDYNEAMVVGGSAKGATQGGTKDYFVAGAPGAAHSKKKSAKKSKKH